MDKDYEELLKPGTLIPWLDDRVPELGDGPLQAEVLSGGSTNLVLKITRGKQSMALRRPAVSKRQDSNKVIDREARLLAALNDTNVPHPYCYSYCDDEAVIGVRFFIMELIDGWQSAQVADCPPPSTNLVRPDLIWLLRWSVESLNFRRSIIGRSGLKDLANWRVFSNARLTAGYINSIPIVKQKDTAAGQFKVWIT